MEKHEKEASEIIENREAIKLLKEEWADFYQALLPEPRHFITLTYERQDVHPDKAMKDLKFYIAQLNYAVLGKNYKNKVKHSYFSYVAVMERQMRGTVHWHILADNWLNWKLAHSIWSRKVDDRGHQWIAPVKSYTNHKSGGTVTGAYNYLAKYMVKQSSVDLTWIRNNYFRLLPHQQVMEPKKEKDRTPIPVVEQGLGEGVKPEAQAVQSRLGEPS